MHFVDAGKAGVVGELVDDVLRPLLQVLLKPRIHRSHALLEPGLLHPAAVLGVFEGVGGIWHRSTTQNPVHHAAMQTDQAEVPTSAMAGRRVRWS